MVRAASARSVSYRLVIVLLKPELRVQELERGRSNLKVILLGALVFLQHTASKKHMLVCSNIVY